MKDRIKKYTSQEDGITIGRIILIVVILVIVIAVIFPITRFAKARIADSTVRDDIVALNEEMFDLQGGKKLTGGSGGKGIILPTGVALKAKVEAKGWKGTVPNVIVIYPNCSINTAGVAQPNPGQFIVYGYSKNPSTPGEGEKAKNPDLLPWSSEQIYDSISDTWSSNETTKITSIKSVCGKQQGYAIWDFSKTTK